jgi:enoyl-CoA hydratase/carnithine racemase
MAESDILRFDRRTNHVVLTLNRPEKRNALNRTMFEALDHALAAIEADKSIRAMVLRGEGSAFSSGVDLRELEQIESSGARWGVTPQEVFRRLEALPIPTVAAVQGATLTGGLVLALLCDLRVAAENAGLGMTPARIGRVPDYFIFRKFIALVGPAHTAEIMFTAEPLSAKRAYEIGLVDRVVVDERLATEADAMAERIAANAPLSLRAMKASIRRCLSDTYNAEHKDIDEMRAAVLSSRDGKEGVRAFLEKRKPVWSGE